MLKQFHLGRNREFFQLWNEYIPDNVRSDDIVAQKLEFYLHIYFAIHPLKKGEKVGSLMIIDHFVYIYIYHLIGFILHT